MGKRRHDWMVPVCIVIGTMSLATTCTTFAQVGTPAASDSGTDLSASTANRYQARATDAAEELPAHSSVVRATRQASGGDGLIPAERRTTWNPGLNSVGGIPNRTTTCATVTASTYGNGTADATAGIQAAIDACPAGQVVQLSAGDFRITSALMIRTGITLRGQGRSETKLKMPVGTNDNVVTIGGNQWTSLTQSRNLTADAAKGSYWVTLASNPGLTVGEIVLLDQLTDSALTTWGANCPAGNDCRGWFTRTNRPIGQVVEIASISGNVITFTSPLHIAFAAGSSAQLSRFVDSSNGQIITAARYAGIENLYVSGGSNNQIRFNIAAYSWMKGVESDNHLGHSVDIAASFRCEVRDSYIHSAQESVPGGGAYGLAFVFYASDNLAENNIVWNMNKVMVMEASGGGNVIAYNYMEDGWITYNTDWMETGLNASHMTTPHMELFEGNQAFNMDGDNTWGNAIYITALRNHLTGRRRGIPPVAILSDAANRRAIGLMEGHWWYTFVGNVLGYAGQSAAPYSTFAYEDTYPWGDEPVPMWRLGYNPENWNAVADPKVLSTLIRGGNYDYVTNQVHWENVTQQDLPDSLYLTAKPAFFGSYAWPWVDPAGATKLHTLPARYCFEQGLMPDCVSGGSSAWIQPIGVPIPSFGVAETIPPNPSPWNASNTHSSGYAFYYICPSCSGATDTSNAYGYPGKARVSMPGTVNGPAVIMLDGQIDTDMSFTGNGSAASPIFVTSYDIATPSTLTVGMNPRGSYIILDGLWLGPRNASDVDFGFWLSEGAHHIALRNSELAGNLNRAGGVGLGTWNYSGSQYVSNIVIDNNYIHHLGDTSATSDQDAHCVTLNGSQNNIWVTHNRFEYCGGDSMQVEAQRNRRAFIHHVYYGQNTSSHNRQSGGWVKNATDVIFSQNVAHDFRDNSGGPGICYGFQYDAEYVWFLFNEGYQCNIGIGISGSDVSPGLYAFIIGNIIHDTQSQGPTDVYNAGAMVIRGGTNVYVVNNTMYNVDAGVNMPPGTQNVHYYNNIIANRTNAASYDLYTEGSTVVDARNNVFGTNARFSGATAGTNALLANPQFVNPAGNDYHLQSASPARDAGILSTVYATFQSRYGIDISQAYDGAARPQGSAWDIGAYEYQAGGGDTTPPTVSLTVPAAGATVSGAVTVSATASDNVGVAGIQFTLDGAPLGAEDTTSPYSISWNTTSTTDGTHTLSATARDAAGNSTNAATVSVTVSNVVNPPPSTRFVGGDRVQVSSGPLNVRATPTTAGTLLGTQANGIQGTVTAGPTVADGFNWWNINYDSGADGWSVEDVLVKAAPLPGTSVFKDGFETALSGWTQTSSVTWYAGTPRNGTHAVQLRTTGSIERAISLAGYQGAVITFSMGANSLDSASETGQLLYYNGSTWQVLAQIDNGSANENNLLNPYTITLPASVNTLATFAIRFTLNGSGTGDYLYVDDVEVRATPSGGGGDTLPPTIAMTAPTGGSTVSGSAVTLSANASDNVGVAGVQFTVDGANLGAEDTTAPYAVTWDSTTATNGAHTLMATARDAAGNQTTATNVSVTVSNTTPPPSSTITIGEATITPINDSGNANLLLAQQATLSQTATIQSMSFYVTAAAGNLRLGMYDATGPSGGPGAKKAETAAFTPVVGWNTANVISQVSLAPGTYWLAYLTDNNALGFRNDQTGQNRFYGCAYGMLPATFSTSPTSGAFHFSLYATLNAAPDTVAPSTPAGLSATAISSSQIDLAWTASTDNVGVTGYTVLRGGVQVATPTTNSYQDTSVVPSTSYTYTVSAYDAAGNNSAQSTSASATTPASTPSSLWVSAYYAGWYWDWTGFDPAVAVAAVDMTTMTHFIFGRYAPGAGTLGGSAGQLLDGAGTGHAQVEDLLIAKAHANGVKALAMLGGAGDGSGWGVSTANASMRATFIANILNKAVAKNYDGVDVDWEENLTTTVTQSQLIALLTELRSAAALRPRYQAPNAPFLITFPAFYLNINVNSVDPWEVTVASLSDQYNIMTYDMTYCCSGWDTWLWAALTGAGPTHPTSIESSIQAYVDAGVPRSTLGMGLGLYGSGYGPPVTGPRQTVSGTWGGDDNINTWEDFYNQGMLSGTGVTYTFDAAAQAGYYTYSPAKSYRGNNVSMLITEDVQSIAAKGAWAKAGNVGGTIVWTVNYGYVASLGSNPPMQAVKAAFLDGGGGDITPPTVSVTAPASGATVSGAVTVSATGSDNVGVSGVQFTLDGAHIGTEDTTSPYSITWSTTSTTDGTHTLSATARDAAGNQGTATNVSVTVSNAAPGDTTAPSVPAGLSATAISSSQIDLAWTASTDNVAVTGYKIHRGGTHVGTSATHSYSDTGLTASTAYSYTVSAYDAAGNNSAQSTSASATTPAPPDTTAPALSSVFASSITQTGATVTWTTDEPATTQVDYGLTTGYGSQTTLNSSLLTSHSASLSGLSAGTTYHYRVRSADGAGNLALSGDVSLQTLVPPDTTAPSAVSNLATVNPTTNGVTVTWTAPGDDGSIGTATAYEIRYSTSPITAGNFTSATEVTTPPTPKPAGGSESMTIGSLQSATTYYVALRTRDEVPNVSALSNVAPFTTQAVIVPDTTPPTVTNIAESAITTNTATIIWTTNEPATAEVRYGLTAVNLNQTVSVGTLQTAQSVALTGLSRNTTYFYQSRSKDAAGNQGVSPTRSFKTLQRLPKPRKVNDLRATAGSVDLPWDLTGPLATPRSDTNVSAGTSYDYAVIPVHGIGTSPVLPVPQRSRAVSGNAPRLGFKSKEWE